MPQTGAAIGTAQDIHDSCGFPRKLYGHIRRPAVPNFQKIGERTVSGRYFYSFWYVSGLRLTNKKLRPFFPQVLLFSHLLTRRLPMQNEC